MTSDQRAADEQIRLQWILKYVKGAGSVIDLAGPDTPLVRLVRTATGANGNWKAADWADVALCCDLLHTRTSAQGRDLLSHVQATTLIVIVPNRGSKASRTKKLPKHPFSAATLRVWLDRTDWYVIRQVEPIVGTLSDSIWLGAVCHRR